MPKNAEQLILAMCKACPAERLGNHRDGLKGIRRHKFFRGFDWQGLAERSLKPPFVPAVAGPFDVRHFDAIADEQGPPVPDEESGWDKDF